MAIRKSPYRGNPNGMDDAFWLPERDENEKRQSPEVKVRRARREETSVQEDERTMRSGSLASLFDARNGTGAARGASRRGEPEMPADALLFGGPDVDDDELEEYAPERRTVTFGDRTDPSQRGFAMDAREKKRRKAARTETRADERSAAEPEAGAEDGSTGSRDGRKNAAKSRKESPMRLASLLEEPVAGEKDMGEKDMEGQAAAMSRHDAADVHARGEDGTGTPRTGGFTFPSRKKARREEDSGTLAFPTRFLRHGPEPLEEEDGFDFEETRASGAFREHGRHDGFVQGAADRPRDNGSARAIPQVGSRDGLEARKDAGAPLRRTSEDGGSTVAEDAGNPLWTASPVQPENGPGAGGERRDIRAMSREERGNALRVARQNLFFPRPGTHVPDMTAAEDATTPENLAHTVDLAKDYPDVAHDEMGVLRPGVEKLSDLPDLAAIARLEEEDVRHGRDEAESPDTPEDAPEDNLEDTLGDNLGDSLGDTLGDTVEDNLWADLWDKLETEVEADVEPDIEPDVENGLDDDAGEAIGEGIKDAIKAAIEDDAREEPVAGATALSGEEAHAPASASGRTRAKRTRAGDVQKAPAEKRKGIEDIEDAEDVGDVEDVGDKDIAAKAREDVKKNVQKNVRKVAREDVSEDVSGDVSGEPEVPNLLNLKEGPILNDLGPGTTPRARVHFARFLTWNTLARHVVSLRDEYGYFAAPGLVGALEDNRAAAPILGILRKAAKKRGWPFYVHRIFVPVIYPDQVDYRLWKQAGNASEQSMVFLHHWLRFASQDEVLSHFGISLPKTLRPRNVTRCVWEHRESLSAFFEDPRHANCRGLILREGADLFFGPGSPLGNRPVNYCILRPEWVVDVRPVGTAQYLLSTVRRSPKSYLERIRKLLVTTPDELAAAKRAEDRSAKRSGQEALSSVNSGVNDGLELILSAHKPYGRKYVAGMV